MTKVVKTTVATVVALGFAAACAHSATAATKHHTAKPKVEYLRSAAPADPKQK